MLRSVSFILIVSSAVLLHSQVAPLPPAPSQIKGKQIIDKAVQALGGGSFLNMYSRFTYGRIYGFFHDKLSGLEIARTYVEYAAELPAKGLGQTERQVLGKKQDYGYLFLPDQAFDLTFRGARPVEDESWDRYRRSTENDILYLLRFRLKEPGLTFDYVGSEVVLSNHVEIVDVSDSQDRTIRVYFDHNTMLPVRQSFSWLDPVTKDHNDEVTYFDKWREAGFGVMWPYSVERQRNGYKSFESFAEQVEINKALPAAIFELPAGAKVLKKVE